MRNGKGYTMIGIFSFGEVVHKVEQNDRTPKQVFILGVYASTVHTRWEDDSCKTVVQVLRCDKPVYS